MNYASSESFTSEQFPGVSYTLRKRSAARRAAFNLSIAVLNARVQTLQNEGEVAEGKTCDCTHKVSEHSLLSNECSAEGCTCKQGRGEGFQERNRIWFELQTLDRDEIQPKRLRQFVKTIDGLDIDGQPATLETLISDGPDELLDEVDVRIKKLMGLSAAEQKNSESPTTSGVQVEQATTDSTAPSAAIAAGTSTGTA